MIVAPMNQKKTIVVIGNGMVGQRFCEKLVEFDTERRYRIVTFCEEPRAAYDRVGLTSFFAHRDAEKLMLARLEWYREQRHRAAHRRSRRRRSTASAQVVRSDKGVEIAYDYVVLATGSFPFVPPVPGIDKPGVFVYRTIEDLRADHRLRRRMPSAAAVIGGGLLGLEAAKAAYDLGLETHVVEFAPRLMPRQIDDAGSQMLVQQDRSAGRAGPSEQGDQGDPRRTARRAAWSSTTATQLDVDMIIVSAGIRPRDELATAMRPRRRRARRHRRSTTGCRRPIRDIFAIGEVRPARRHDLRPGRARLRDGRDRGREPDRRQTARFAAPTCRPSSS